nr:hypothetical protein [Nitrospiraceae bacterium]
RALIATVLKDFNKKQIELNEEQNLSNKLQNDRWLELARPQFSFNFDGGVMPDESHKKFTLRFVFRNTGQTAARNISLKIIPLEKEIQPLDKMPYKIAGVVPGDGFQIDSRFTFAESAKNVTLLEKKFVFYIQYSAFKGEKYIQKIPYTYTLNILSS